MKTPWILFCSLILLSCMQPQNPKPLETQVSNIRSDSIKQWITRYLEEVWNKRDFTNADKYWGPEFVNVFSPESGKGPEAMRQQVDYFLKAFENSHFELKNILVQGDQVALWIEISGKHTGELFGIPATHKEVRFREAVWYTLKNGKLHEVYPFVDWNDLFRQLGKYPTLD